MTSKYTSKLFSSKTFLLLDGIFLMLIGFPQTINSFVGHFYGKGFYKILQTTSFAAIGIFETSFLLGIIGVLLLRASRKESDMRFWLWVGAIVHLFIGTANVLFWEVTFPVNNAAETGKIATALHFGVALVEIVWGLFFARKEKT